MDLKIIGKQHIGKYEFTGIEGGFGKNKKSMLALDIAKVHNQPVGNVNRLINNNRKWFEDGIDIIDLKDNKNFAMLLKQSGFSTNKINALKYIYLLSERGYSLLVKFMDDEKATQIYKEILNNYFNMRLAVKTNQPALLKGKRLSIMETNAATRRAKLVYDIALKIPEGVEQQRLLAKAAAMITGETTIPVMKKAEYSAQQVAKKIGHGLTANMVGRIANKLNLKADQPEQNKYGRWANSKSRYSSKETPQWLYFDEGLKAVKEYSLS